MLAQQCRSKWETRQRSGNRPTKSVNALRERSAREPCREDAGDQTLSLEVVEALFRRLASASRRHPNAPHGMPTGSEAASVLQIVRDFMHHLGCASITVVDAASSCQSQP